MRCDDGRVVSNIICQALAGDDITIYGDGSQTRSLCFVDDLVEGLERLMRGDGVTGPINLGAGRDTIQAGNSVNVPIVINDFAAGDTGDIVDLA